MSKMVFAYIKKDSTEDETVLTVQKIRIENKYPEVEYVYSPVNNKMHSGDVLVVESLNRISKSVVEKLYTCRILQRNNVKLDCLNERLVYDFAADDSLIKSLELEGIKIRERKELTL